MLPRYLAVTAEQIRSVASEVFRPDNRIVLTYLPELPPAESAAATEGESESGSDAAKPESTDEEEVAA
jgi:hypothetical protein